MKKTIKENMKWIKENKAAFAAFASVTIVASSALVLCVGLSIIGGKR